MFNRKRHCLGKENFDKRLADHLAKKLFSGKTVADLGAGVGHYGKILKKDQRLPDGKVMTEK